MIFSFYFIFSLLPHNYVQFLLNFQQNTANLYLIEQEQ